MKLTDNIAIKFLSASHSAMVALPFGGLKRYLNDANS